MQSLRYEKDPLEAGATKAGDGKQERKVEDSYTISRANKKLESRASLLVDDDVSADRGSRDRSFAALGFDVVNWFGCFGERPRKKTKCAPPFQYTLWAHNMGYAKDSFCSRCRGEGVCGCVCLCVCVSRRRSSIVDSFRLLSEI